MNYKKSKLFLMIISICFSFEGQAFKLYCDGWVQTDESTGVEFGKLLEIQKSESRHFLLWKENYDILKHQITLTPSGETSGENPHYTLESLNLKTGAKFSVTGELNQHLSVRYTDSSQSSQARIVYVKCSPLSELQQDPNQPSDALCNGQLKRNGTLVKEFRNEQITWHGRGIGYKSLVNDNGQIRLLVKKGDELRPSANLILNGVNLQNSLNFSIEGEMKKGLRFNISNPGTTPLDFSLSCN